MLKDSYTTKKKASLLPDRRNKYSIRKFTVGTASILVGATLLFGLVTQDAKAAEQSTTSTENAVTSNKDTKVEVNHADAVVNETAKTISPKAERKDVAKEELKTTVETPQETENQVSSEKATSKDESSVSKQQAVPTEKAAPKEEDVASKQPIVSPEKAVSKEETATPKQQVESPEKVVPKEETVALKQQVVPTEKTTAENKADVKQTVEAPKVKVPQPTLEIQQVKDLKTAAEFYAQSSGVSIDDAQTLIKDLNLDSQATPKEIQQALINRLSREYEKWVKPAVRENSTAEAEHVANNPDFAKYAAILPNDPRVIEADAIADGYITSTTDATNAKNTLSGRAWVVDKGTPATMSNGLTAVPQGTDVYMQWIDTDGESSPIFRAKTTNKLSSNGGSQVGPGVYAFDLRKGWTDSNGKTHKYTASAGQKYRLWIDDYQTADGNTATMLRQVAGFFPGTFVNSVTYSNLGQFPLIGTNMQRTGIFMSIKPIGGYMEKDKAAQIHDTAGPINAPAVNLSAKNSVSGKVWLETGAGDYANSATGPNDNEADPQAAGYTVVMSSLTPDGVKAYDTAINNLPESEKSSAVKALLKEHPEYISATVYGETDKDGRYTLRFPDSALNASHIYGYVKKPDGSIVDAYSSFTSPQFRAPNSNISWTPQSSPAQNLVANPMWYNVNFAVIPTADLIIEILKYNTTTTPALPGSSVDITLPGTTMSPLPTHIEWRDEKGNVLVKTPEFTTIKDGEKLGKFQVPKDAKAGSIYTAYLIIGGNDVSADSLIVQTYAEVYEPTAQPIEKPYGQGTTEQEVKDKVTVPNFPADKGTPVVTVDNPTKVPNGQTSGVFDVPVTVTYPDGSKDKTTVKVTVDPKDSDEYEPVVQPIEKPYGQSTTEQEVKEKVSVPNFPTDKGTPVVTVDNPTKVPNGQTSGEFDVPVTVTYPDGTKDHVTVKVTVDPKDSDTYEPVVQPIEKPYGQSTTEQEVKGKVSVPNFPTDKGTPVVTVDDSSKVPNGQTSGVFDVPVTVTYPDGTKDQVTVKVTVGEQPDNVKYEPKTGELTKVYGQPTTADEVKGKVTVPGYPENGQPYTVTVDDTKLPNGETPGTFEVPTTVTYPDKTKDTVNVKVTVSQKDSDVYEPVVQPIVKPYGQSTTEQEIKEKVSVPNFPVDKGTPVITVDNPTKVPNGQTSGEFDVPVTVTYPDDTKDHVTVKVTVGEQLENVKYEPKAGELTKSYGQPTTADEVKGKVTVPAYPENGQPYTVTVDDTKLPNGETSGTFEVPVTVTYPDKTTDTVNVKVTVSPKDSDEYEPVVQPIEKPYGQGTTEKEIKDKVRVPNFPVDKGTPVVTVDDSTKVPNGQTSGVFDVPVTVTYPDGTKDQVTVKVTVGEQPDNVKYEPKTGELTKVYGQPTTADEVKGKVTVPGYPENGQPYTVTVDDIKIPNGQTSGTFEVPATVTYPDKTTDTVNVKVTVDPKDSDVYEPVVQPIEKPYGQGTTEQEIKDKVTVPNFPADKVTPVVTVDNPTKVPNGQTSGVFDVPVTVTYPDGTKDQVTVKVTVGNQPDNVKYEPQAGELTKSYGQPTTADEVKGKVTVPGYPENGQPYTVTVDDTKLPNGQTSGTFEVPTTITYPDKTTDTVNVKVTVNPKDSDVYEPVVQPIEKTYGTPTTVDEVKGKVSVPNFPTDKGTPVVTVDNPTKVPNGQISGVFDIPVTVTYPDGTKDQVTVKVTVGNQPDNVKYEPQAGELTKVYGQPTTADEVKGKVTVLGYPDSGQPYTVTVDETKLPDGQTSGEFEVPVTVTYPDKTTDTVNVKVTVDPKDSDTYEPLVQPIVKPYGQGTTEQEIKENVSVPNFPTDKGTPVVTVDDSSKLPNGQESGVFDIPVTVTYPDGTKDHITVKVTVGNQADNVKYGPQAGELTKVYGQPTTVDEVKGKVTVPGYPENGQPYTVKVDETKLPNGQTSGEFEVPATVTYPDKTTDTVNVKVTVSQKDSDVYEPKFENITKPYGQPTTVDEVKNTVTVPNFPADKGTPAVSVDDPTKIPNGQTQGVFDVPVTVTYPDGTKDHVTVKVTVGNQPDNVKYEPQAGEIMKSYGQPTTADEVKGKVTVPGYPSNGQPYTVKVDETKIPDGQTSGAFEVPVTVTYPDKTTDTVNVKVIVSPKDSDVYEPVVQPIEKPYGQGTTEQEIKDKVTVPNFSADKGTPVVSVDDPTKVPNGQTQGVFDVPVTVTYPDGTKDHVTVKVTVGNQPDNVKYEPQVGEITKAYGQPTTADEVKGKVTVPGYPGNGQPYTVTVDETKIPNGQTSGVFEVPVTVTYPDKTTDTVNVKVTVDPKDSDTYEPTAQPIEKTYGTPTTVDDVLGSVKVPGYPENGKPYTVTVNNPSALPNGQTPGNYEVPVTVTYPDGTKDHIKVTITVHPQLDSDVYNPGYNNVTVNPGKSIEIPQVKDKVPTGTHFEIPKDSGVDKDWKVTVAPDTGTITITAPKDAVEGHVVKVPVTVTYPDGSKDHVTANVTVHDSIAPDAPVVNPIEAGDKTVTGTGKEPDATVRVTFPGGSVASTKVGKDGKWKVDVPSTVKLKVGDTVKAVITDKAGNVSKETVTTVKETVAPSAPVVNGTHTGDKENSPTPNEENTNVSTGHTTNHTDTSKQSTQSEVAKVKATSSTKAAKKAQSTAKALPDTGEDTPNSGTLFGGLFATLGAFLLFRRRRTHDDSK